MNDKKEPFTVIEGGMSNENIWGTPEYDAAQTRHFFEHHPNADFEPAAVGRNLSIEERKRNLLWTREDVCTAFDSVDFLAEMLDLQQIDDDLRAAADAALVCINDLTQYGRTTTPGLGIGVLKAVLRSIPAFRRYFRAHGQKPRASKVIQAEIDGLHRALNSMNDELRKAHNAEGSGRPPSE
jgi:hypothetical protein